MLDAGDGAAVAGGDDAAVIELRRVAERGDKPCRADKRRRCCSGVIAEGG